jgi:hypothetical protein
MKEWVAAVSVAVAMNDLMDGLMQNGESIHEDLYTRWQAATQALRELLHPDDPMTSGD